jgi:hypothetical protein
MRITRDRLIFLGLVALAEVIRECRTAPATPSPALRVVLAMLYELSDGRDRLAFDICWKDCQIAPSETLTEHQANHRRMTELHKCWNRICQSLGVEQTTEFALRIAAARRPRESGHERMARGVKEAGEQKRTFDRHKRQSSNARLRVRKPAAAKPTRD